MSHADGVPSLQRLIVPIVAVLAASVVAMALAAGSGAYWVSWLAAAASLVAIVVATLRINAPLWRPTRADADGDLLYGALRRNARLAALAYAWGSAAMFSVYGFTDLKWQHGFQYATAMALLAGVHLWYVHDMGRAASWLRTAKGLAFGRWLGVLHGAAALGALCFLIGSGKLLLAKPDWVANQVFLTGLLAIVAICALGTFTYSRLARIAPAAL